MENIEITTSKAETMWDFLTHQEFLVEKLEDNIYKVSRDEELPVYVSIRNENIYFEVDLGDVSSCMNESFLFDLLNSNTEILPVSFALDNSVETQPHLLLVESRETGDLCDKELLSVFDALELATDRAESLLSKALKSQPVSA
ncbi:MAG: hypothetical protein HQL32_00410 [Planctomycetes bacterium]|nr:hypothetical protein [Planctomycetota bacterium]